MPASLTVVPWDDPALDALGHDPRSRYVETFWLPTLGPTSVLLLRHLADRFDRSPKGIELPLSETSAALGLGAREGSSSPLVRCLARLAQFDLACDDGRGTVAVRRRLPPVNRRHVRRLPMALQVAHAEWVESRLDDPALEPARRRARRVAMTIVEEGETGDVERALQAVGFHPAVCRDAAEHALRHRPATNPAA